MTPAPEIESALAILESQRTLITEADAYDVAKVRVSFLWAGVQGAMRWYLGREGYKGRVVSKLAELSGSTECLSPEVALNIFYRLFPARTLESAETRMDHYWVGFEWGLRWILGESGPVSAKLADIADGGGLELHTVERGDGGLESWIRANWPAKSAEESRSNLV